MTKKEKWFTDYEKDDGITFRVKAHLYSGKSRYQKIDVYDTHGFGRMLVLDKRVQTTEKDEFLYHEMLVHVPMLTHPNPKHVLIIGGGDGGCLREVLKHRVEKVIMVELDKMVIDVCKRFVSIDGNAWDDKRAEVVIGDGFKYVKNIATSEENKKFDVIIVDSTDPIAKEARRLFTKKFFNNVCSALGNDGVFVCLAGSCPDITPYYLILLKNIYHLIKSVFPITKIYNTEVPSYGGAWSFFIGSKRYDPEGTKIDRKRLATLGKLLCYNPEYHKASFKLPNFIINYLK